MADQLMFWASKFAGSLATLVGSWFGNASVIGGRVALKIFPGFLRIARKQIKFPIVFVMGSNGKTTTSKYLVELAEAEGETVLNNSAGSNMKTGIAAMVIRDWANIIRGKYSLGIFEIDEAYAASIARDLAPEHAVVLNVQIDQIYRLHEPERVADMFARTLPFVTKTVVLNGNDSMLVSLAAGLKASVSFFGLAGTGVKNLGLFQPIELAPSSSAVLVSEVTDGYSVARGAEEAELKVPSAGLHFALNGSAAIAVGLNAFASKPDLATLAESLASSKPAFGRGEIIASGNARFDLILFKNRPSLQLNINAATTPADTIVLAFDEYSQDPSWLFAIDYSPLGKVDWVSGEKADFLELALEYAGVPVTARNEKIKEVVASIDAKYRDAAPSFHRLFLDYDQMMATREYFGLKMGETA